MSETDTQEAEGRSLLTRPTVIGSIVLLTGVVIAALALAVFGGDADPADPDTATASPTAPAPESVSTGPVELPTAGPADTVWTVIDGGAIVPVSAEHGPASDDGLVASGYTRTPEGALVAAAQIAMRSSGQAPTEMWQAVIETQMSPGADADALAAANAAAGAPDGEVEPAHLVGFVYHAFDGTAARFDLVSEQQEAWFTAEITMEWADGDWRMVPPPNGDWSQAISMVFSLEGVTEWGPDV